MSEIINPIIPGFHPDPSFLRVGEDYYIANSTFEWFPGVRIHHSKDLIHWRLIDHGLKTETQLDLLGVPDSGGIWAPSLSWDTGTFYLVYTIVRTWGMGRPFKDHHNYLVTAPGIYGPWSAPVFLNSSGFDPSLFHDDDGRKWVTNIQWDFRPNHPRFDGILLQEYDSNAKKLTGPIHPILRKKELIEGPNLYKHHGYYYLMLAEGGTGWNHSISLARSRSLTGPYELDPQPNILHARDDESIELQKSGHGELVETATGEWYLAHLCSRPVGPEKRCILGRETALQKMEWSADDWLRLTPPGTRPQVLIPAPQGITEHPWPAVPERDDFNEKILDLSWSSLRIPTDESWVTLSERPGWLRLRGRESLHSLHEQSLLARRLTAFYCSIETCLDFQPTSFRQMAGLICYYDTRTHYYLRVTHDEIHGKILGLTQTDDGKYSELSESRISIKSWPLCYLRAEIEQANLQFFASPDGQNWQPIGSILDASKLSDDYGQGLHFTGAFVGLCAQDLGGTRAVADFDYFSFRKKST